MQHPSESFRLATDNMSLEASIVPWDTAILGVPVAAIRNVKVVNLEASVQDFARFDSWLNDHHCQMVSCRLAHDQLRESIFLEDFGFRFIEMVLHPMLEGLENLPFLKQGLKVLPATGVDIDNILRIAKSAFTHERFYIDPRLSPQYSHQRYGRWARSALDHPRQRLLKILDGDMLIAFFVVEEIDSHSVYWHLTAVSPDHHGKGYGYRTWLSVLEYHKENGLERVHTTISARNSAVLNLYSKLNFRFHSPEITFHWMRK